MKDKVFFNGLNELRAFAALAVVLHHIELYKHRLHISSLYDVDVMTNFVRYLGKNGVFLFFVLSGFLITYLLLEEKGVTGKISVSKFYSRRILRIWPLYFIILGISFFLLPWVYKLLPDFFQGQTDFNEKIENLVYGNNLILHVFFLSKVALRVFGPVVGASQSWSVSVEEQFYLIWPWIIKYFSNFLWLVLPLIVVGVALINYKISLFNSYTWLKAFLATFHIDFMAIGGLLALLYRNYKPVVRGIVTNKIFNLLIILSVILHLVYPISHITLAISFGLLILSCIENNVRINIFSKLGKWSYGIYMYHPLVMYFTFALATKMEITTFICENIFYYILIIGITVLLSYLSYTYLELYFLKLKQKFSPVISGSI